MRNKIIISLIVLAAGILFYVWRTYETTVILPPLVEPAENATQDERLEYAGEVTERAVSSRKIIIKACLPDPEIANFALGESVTFKNKDLIGHMISFSTKHEYELPAEGELVVGPDMLKFRGIWKYYCDSAPAGTIVITE